MHKLHAKTRMALAEQVASVLTQSTVLQTVNLNTFSYFSDEGEGEVILEALNNCASLPQLKSLDCSQNATWFSDAKMNLQNMDFEVDSDEDPEDPEVMVRNENHFRGGKLMF